MKRLVGVAAFALAMTSTAAERLVEGNAASRVRLLVYEDLQCPDCADFRRMLDEKVLPKYGGKVAVDHRDFPLAKHAWARRAAIAARFFGEIGPELGLKYRKYSFAGIGKATGANFNERLMEFAKANGVDPAKAVAALEDANYADAVEADVKEGVARGVAHTPTVYVNGTAFIETFTFEELSSAIDSALRP